VTSPVSRFTEQAKLSARALLEYGQHLLHPTIRLGVTGLSRAGKTVFITALVHGLLRGGRFPVFEAHSGGRIAGARLSPQPDDGVPRFDYEKHLRALIEERQWPESTKHISELRLIIDYQSRSGADRTLTLDLVDYPGEWLLDLPLLGLSYEQWSAESLRRSRQPPRDTLARPWHDHLRTLDPLAQADENDAIAAAKLFTRYLRACRDERFAMSVLPPGRFLMPGDLEDSPALTFAPLDLPAEAERKSGSLWSMMRRRYEAYKDLIVRPFFVDHFQRLDRQIVLVDALAAFNAGSYAIQDLESALTDILGCFHIGRRTLFSIMFNPRADKVLFAATKADHLHHSNHDRLETILRRMVDHAVKRAEFSGAAIDVVALSAVRATREAMVSRGGETLPSIAGIPALGEKADDKVFDGHTEIVVFPGDLPADSEALFGAVKNARPGAAADEADLRFLRFRPPPLEVTGEGVPALPHIRFDRALQFLIGDRLP
jgi:predicted YcjX-like family ATPase